MTLRLYVVPMVLIMVAPPVVADHDVQWSGTS